MDEWLQAQLAAGLPAFRGSTVSGTLALNQDLLNELLANWLASQTSEARGGSPAAFDVNRLLPMLKQASIRVEPGTVLVDFQVGV